MATLPLLQKLFLSSTKSAPLPLKVSCCLFFFFQSRFLKHKLLTTARRGIPWRSRAKGTGKSQGGRAWEGELLILLLLFIFFFTKTHFISDLMTSLEKWSWMVRPCYQGSLEHKKLKWSLVPREMGVHRRGNSTVVRQGRCWYDFFV